MERSWWRTLRPLHAVVVVAVVASTLASCGNAPLNVVTHAGDADGVTDHTITVG